MVIALAAVAVGPAAAPEASSLTSMRVAYSTISVEQLAQTLGNKDFVLINVHIPYEGEIALTDLFIPFDQIAARISELPPDKSAKIVLYCRSGRMSEIAATTLSTLGYSNVAHLAQGMNGWAASGQELAHRRQ
ncbi:rhodanese-like domain-containing protein [Devosia sp.]|uniref:rhodanese-like domain-containing protein n=1 Tax=Devosia sp. TaxID=1871048 RepID=UPI003F704DA1